MLSMRVEVRLLGAVQLYGDGRPAALGAAKRQVMLVALALEANRSVSLGRLSEMVWAGPPPRSAIANLRSHAAALRQILGDRLVAERGGYRLRLAPGELDVDEFRRLAEAGRDALAADDPQLAVSCLTSALQLWRGRAGDGLPGGTAVEARLASLDEQRLPVVEDLVEARLRQGEHLEVVPVLRQHLHHDPLRERAWGQLMLALYRSGDAAAALGAYQEVRRVLDEQLGVAPGPELSALHRAVLDRAPSLNLTRDRIVTTFGGPELRLAVEAPRELPPDGVELVGRDAEVAELLTAVRGAGRVPTTVALSGPGGSGRSALVVRVARLTAAEFPDGQVFIDLRRHQAAAAAITPVEVVARALRALDVPAAEPFDGLDELTGRYRSVLARRRVLLVVDDAEHAAQVRPLVPAEPGCAVIVTCRGRLHTLDGVRHVSVRPLAPPEGYALLASLVGAARLDAEPEATAELVRRCAGLPLALRVAGAQLAGRPEWAVALLTEQLADERHRLDVLMYGDLSVRDSVAAGYHAVRAADELTGQVFRLLGELPSPVLPAQVAARLDVPAFRAWRALEGLVDAQLARGEARGGYRLLPFVAEYAVELAARSGPVTQPAVVPRPRSGRDPSIRSAAVRTLQAG
ncbi:BTAD domain-containing putative transcriptional regulator [Plantactinospora sp. B5E13]|uniref:AfsR/SARP family transcriptional regulator n=1 Tax=unclassified Plantactinospora TaxID=2631981 RepID=UPI00325C88DD